MLYLVEPYANSQAYIKRNTVFEKSNFIGNPDRFKFQDK